MLLTLFELATIYCPDGLPMISFNNSLRPFSSLFRPPPALSHSHARAVHGYARRLDQPPAASDAAPVNFVIVRRIKTDIIKENYSFRAIHKYRGAGWRVRAYVLGATRNTERLKMNGKKKKLFISISSRHTGGACI